MPSYSHVMSGGVVLNGSFATSVIRSASTSGGALLAGSANLQGYFSFSSAGGPVLTSGSADYFSVITQSQSFFWNIDSYLNLDQMFHWNIGQPPQRWYRVQGACTFTNPDGGLPDYPGGCDVVGIQNDDQQCKGGLGRQQFVQNILATTVEEVCKELKRSKLNWRIFSIKKWSRPADYTLDTGDPCNKLETVSFNDLPECLEFTVETNALIKMGISAEVIESMFFYVGSGGMSVGGGTFDGGFYYEGSGTVRTGGSAESAFLADEYVINMGMTFSVELSETFLPLDDTLPAFAIPTGAIVTSCSTCTAMPLQFYFQHNLYNPSILYNFLKRNGFQLPSVINMRYDKKMGSWTSNLHYIGLSDDNFNNESWRFSFDFSCTDQLGGESTGNPIIKFGILIVRKNLYTNDDYDTRILFSFPSFEFCKAIRNFLDNITFSINTRSAFVNISPAMTLNTIILYDKIGVFNSQFWTDNPLFTVTMSGNQNFPVLERKNLSALSPQPDNLSQSGLEIVQNNGIIFGTPINPLF